MNKRVIRKLLTELTEAGYINPADVPDEDAWEVAGDIPLLCPYHELPGESDGSCTWLLKAESLGNSAGVFHCFRSECFLPDSANDVAKTWKSAAAARAAGEKFPGPFDGGPNDNVIQIKSWGKGGAAKAKRTGGHYENGVHQEITDEEWQAYQEYLEDNISKLTPYKPLLALATLQAYEWAWQVSPGRFLFPIYRLDGSLESYKYYQPWHEEKSRRKRWLKTRKEAHQQQLYGVPQYEMRHDSVIVPEGETDCMLMWQDGFRNVVTQTGGAGSWESRYNDWFRDKIVYISYDADQAGNAGANRPVHALKGIAKAIYRVMLPAGKDYNDWRQDGGTVEEYKHLLADAELLWDDSTDAMPDEGGKLPADGVPLVSLSELKDIHPTDGYLKVRAHALAGAEAPWMLPRTVAATCMMNQKAACASCVNGENIDPTPNQARTGMHITNPATDDWLLSMAGAGEERGAKLIRSGIPLNCSKNSVESLDHWMVEYITVQDPADVDRAVNSDSSYSTYYFYDEGTPRCEVGHDYSFIGRKFPDPRSQELAFATWGAARTTTDVDHFQATPEIVKRLSKFRPIKPGYEGVARAIQMRHLGLASQVTGIFKRPDLHLMIDLVMHSAASFSYDGKNIDRGMLDAMIMGDPRTGKSEATSKLIEFYRAGYMIAVENASYAGIVGGSGETGNSKSKVPVWGVLPRHHRRMVAFDEVSGMRGFIGQMSSVRSSGRAEIQKMGGGSVPAMVRLLWMSNPVQNDRTHDSRMLEAYTDGAIHAIRELVGTQEDIARFDIAMCVGDGEVTRADKDTGRRRPHALLGGRSSAGAYHDLVMFAWSRKSDDVTFTPESIETINTEAGVLAGKYLPNPPLVQEINVDDKLAKIAVAVAIMVYSTDEEGSTVIVRPEHVEFASKFMQRCYDHPLFGYGKTSADLKRMAEKAESNSPQFLQWLIGKEAKAFQWGISGIDLVRSMSALENGISGREFKELFGLLDFKALQEMTGLGYFIQRGSRYIPTPSLIKLLREAERRING